MRLMIICISFVMLVGCANAGKNTAGFFQAWGRVANNLEQKEQEHKQQQLLDEQLRYYQNHNNRLPSQQPGTYSNPVYVKPVSPPIWQNPMKPLRPTERY